jgi:hypothetical protein
MPVMNNREYLNEIAADIAYAWDLHIKYSNNELMVQTSGHDGDAAVCYLCLDGGLDDAGQPLQRDCACRGTDAGYVHLACLTNYAIAKSEQARDTGKLRNPWEKCPNCHQQYQNFLAIDLATEFVSYVRRKYPDNTQMQVEALHVKMRAFDSMIGRLQPIQKREAGITATVLLSLIDRKKNESPLTMRYSQMEAEAHNTHGRIALQEGTEESARRAVIYFEKALEVCKAIGVIDGIATAKRNIAFAKSKYEGGNNEEVLKATHDVYKLRVAEYGEGSEVAIDAGKKYAIALWKANRGGEAMKLFTKLLATSKQVLGSHHSMTKEVESELRHFNNLSR